MAQRVLHYSVWFNRRHQRSGNLPQGRLGAGLVGDEDDWLEEAGSVHWNPNRVTRLGLTVSRQM